MSIPRKITIEILTTDDSNIDPILLLLEACKVFSRGGTNLLGHTTTTEISTQSSFRQPDPIPSKPCVICGEYKPINTIVCFGCIVRDVKTLYERDQHDVNPQSEP